MEPKKQPTQRTNGSRERWTLFKFIYLGLVRFGSGFLFIIFFCYPFVAALARLLTQAGYGGAPTKLVLIVLLFPAFVLLQILLDLPIFVVKKILKKPKLDKYLLFSFYRDLSREEIEQRDWPRSFF